MKVHITIAGMDYHHGTSFNAPQMIGNLIHTKRPQLI